MKRTLNIVLENTEKLDHILRTLAEDAAYRKLQNDFALTYDGLKAQLTPQQKAALVEILDLYGDMNDHLLTSLYLACITDGRQQVAQQAAM